MCALVGIKAPSTWRRYEEGGGRLSPEKAYPLIDKLKEAGIKGADKLILNDIFPREDKVGK